MGKGELMSMKVAVIGAGYWGKNLVRNFSELGSLAMVCDVSEATCAEIGPKYNVSTTTDVADVLKDTMVHGVVIAAPAVQHYDLAKKALSAGKDVYVEKPLALTAAEGRELTELAATLDRVLMVGHILEYHPAVIELKRMVAAGELGKIHYIYSSRLNIGKLRTEENILWSFAPHDVSAICSLLGESPTAVASHGGSYLNQNIYDTTLTTCEFRSGVQAHIFVSWLHPFKEQKLCLVGSEKLAVFDDVETERKLVVYSHQINWQNRVPVAQKGEGQVVSLPKSEPLKAECAHFLECVAERKQPRTDGAAGVRVLEILEACERSLKSHGQPMEVAVAKAPKPAYFAHKSAVVDDGCEIGEGTKIWHFSHVMPKCKIGKGCNIGQNVVISPDVVIGNNVKIQNNVSVYTGVILEDDVFCGPSMVFTNVMNPRSHIVRRNEYKTTLIKKGATLGANSTIVCGHTVGEYAFIAAGAVVATDVEPYALIAGVPARKIGYMCHCGIKLRFAAAAVPEGNAAATSATCGACGAEYEKTAVGVSRTK
jgi:UDP-2-acetamido-3-amino-2,3-dideoxy-glucuronate N-acetyltransferase